jgi:hypothetical protein
MVGGGQIKENDIVRNSFSLLVNPDEEMINELKEYFNDENTSELYQKLINNITILKAISCKTSDRKEIKAMSKAFVFN